MQTRIDLGKSYGVTKYQLEMLDDIELLCEIGFLINCDIIDKCRSCRQLLKFSIKILLNRWDEIRFINFFDALKIVKDYKGLFKEVNFVLCWHEQRYLVKKLIKEFRNNLDNDPVELINKHDFLFNNSIILKGTIRLAVFNYSDPLNLFLNNLLFIFWSCFLPKFSKV